MGRNSYRNLVSCCLECNAKKGQSPAEDLLRWLYRERRLTPLELSARPRLRQAPASFALPDRQAARARQASGLLENLK